MTKSSHVHLPTIEAENLCFEVSADLDLASPLIFVKTEHKDRLISQTAVLSPRGLESVSDSFLEASQEFEERYEKYWQAHS